MNVRRLLPALLGVCASLAGSAEASELAAPPAPPIASQRDHVYIFLVNGLDPFYFCQFDRMPDYVRSLGYQHVYLGQMTAKGQFLDEIRRIRKADPSARVVLFGFSTGANTVCSMSHVLRDEGGRVDLLIYLGGCYIFNNDASRPENAMRIVNIRDSGLVTATAGLLRGDALDGVENVQIPGPTLHLTTPANTVTQNTMARELAALAATVPPQP